MKGLSFENNFSSDILEHRFLSECSRLNIVSTHNYLIVNILHQKLYQYKDGKLIQNYIISTSENPLSCTENSNGTPWGMHKIVLKIGSGEPSGMVFKGRKSTGTCYWECPEHPFERLITSRILWLQGLEDGINAGDGIDSYNRYIYIHGTNREHLLGKPVTLGCITLSNLNVISLYNSVDCETLVWITET